MKLRLSVLGLALMLGACGGVSRHCVGEYPYQSAETLPTPTNIEGLELRDSAAAMRIPPAPENPVPFARQVADPANPDNPRVECLDLPPRMKVTPESAQVVECS